MTVFVMKANFYILFGFIKTCHNKKKDANN